MLEEIWRHGEKVEQQRRDGGVDVCKCPDCGYSEKHDRGTACTEMSCPICGSKMVGDCERTSGLVEESVAVHFNKFNEHGLTILSKFFERRGYTVEAVDVNDKLQKKDGMPTKSVKWTFDDGQSIEVVFAFIAKGNTPIEKSLGFAFSAKVNGTIVPIRLAGKKESQTITALEKLEGFLKAESTDEAKAKRSEAERKKLLAASRSELQPDTPKVPTTVAAKYKAAIQEVAEKTTMLEIATKQLQDEKGKNPQLQKQYEKKQATLASLQETEQSLKSELQTLLAA